jgi:hypothetical protein
MPYHQAPRTGDDEAAGTAAFDRSVRRTFQRLRLVGLSNSEAANLTAHLSGLRVGRQPWTVSEIERLLFLRVLVESGRIDEGRIDEG